MDKGKVYHTTRRRWDFDENSNILAFHVTLQTELNVRTTYLFPQFGIIIEYLLCEVRNWR